MSRYLGTPRQPRCRRCGERIPRRPSRCFCGLWNRPIRDRLIDRLYKGLS